MSTVKMQYHGPAHKMNRTIQLPVPFTQRSVKDGTVEFVDGLGDVPQKYVQAFAALGVFTIVALPSDEAGKEESCQPPKKKQK